MLGRWEMLSCRLTLLLSFPVEYRSRLESTLSSLDPLNRLPVHRSKQHRSRTSGDIGLVYTGEGGDQSRLCHFSYVNNVAEVDVLRSTHRSVFTVVSRKLPLPR
ncbi:hypothetical protein UY3_06007 [Chelonia mydas]|uniref:Secreted protein n=1 Tax=Chelonia mydas TaxID=8469 RepID=M7BFV9_CHEMY|nr:hypothetical protein UY3_06007 [Chelonia mydas]